MSGIDMQCTCEMAPLQFQGSIEGNPAYYRCRHGHWRLVVTKPGTDPVFGKDEDLLYHASGEGYEWEVKPTIEFARAAATLRKKA